jgi:hypothetical protein
MFLIIQTLPFLMEILPTQPSDEFSQLLALQALSMGFSVQMTLPGCLKLRGASSSSNAAKHVQAMEQDHSGGVV